MPSLVERLKTYLFPDGDAAARAVTGIRTIQSGDVRASASAAWKSFHAEEIVDATESMFSWDATLGSGIAAVHVTDGYDRDGGRLVVRKGPLTVAHLAGPHMDQSELQRYLSYIPYCPSMILNNPFLDFAAVGLDTLRIRDRRAAIDAGIALQLGDDGRPLATRAVRPMTIGRRIVPTEWSAIGSDPQLWHGMRMCRHLEAAWHPPDGEFVYVRIDVLSQSMLRVAADVR